MVGAILTQNTAWTNVERAIKNLRQAKLLQAKAIVLCRRERLAKHLRPSGYFNVKAKRLKNYCSWYLGAGEYRRLKHLETTDLRRALLAVNGVGPETADDILLYAFDRPVFVVDAYTRRLFERLGVLSGAESYEEVRGLFESGLGLETSLFNEYHALIVHHAKHICRPRPLCADCVLSEYCSRQGAKYAKE